MPLFLLLFLSSPCFARLYVDYTQSPAVQRPIPNAAVLVTPASAAQAEDAGYPPRDIAVKFSPSLLPAHDVQSLSAALTGLSKKGRYGLALDLQGLSPPVKENLKKNAAEAAKQGRIKTLLFIENPPLLPAGTAAQQDAAFFKLVQNLSEGQDAFAAASLLEPGHNTEVLRLILNPKQKHELLSWEQGFAFIFPEAVFVYNSGSLGIFSLPKELFSKKGEFSSKSYAGSMVLWQENDSYKMLTLPNSAAFWRMK